MGNQEEIVQHRLQALEGKQDYFTEELGDVKNSVTAISTQTSMIVTTLGEIKDAMNKVAEVATDVKLAQQSIHEVKLESEKSYNDLSTKLNKIDTKLETKEDRLRRDVDKKIDALSSELKESRKEFRDEQTWFKRLVYSALIMGIIGLGMNVIKNNTVVEKQYHIVNNHKDSVGVK